ncbi:hypothetical protein [uncultured Oscillibacter sp.]|uniref:hypothetical protein n=1 Tax=uncultured Oscillibacter sp. TaxID=876091 RepID=UPI00262ED3E3|nr:hypothetical protein [uncultured Oscillibacter sp.]
MTGISRNIPASGAFSALPACPGSVLALEKDTGCLVIFRAVIFRFRFPLFHEEGPTGKIRAAAKRFACLPGKFAAGAAGEHLASGRKKCYNISAVFANANRPPKTAAPLECARLRKSTGRV